MAQRHLYPVGQLALPMSSSAYSIAPGDGVVKGTGPEQASGAGWGAEIQARKKAAAEFLGIADEGSPADSDRDVVIREKGVFELPCTSCTPSIDDLFGFEKDSGGNYLDPDKLQLVIDPAEAEFRCVENYAAATTTVRVAMLPRKAANPRINEFWFPPISIGSTHRSSTAGRISNYTFGRKVKLLEGWAMHIRGVLSSDYGIVFQNDVSQIMTSTSFAAGATDGALASCDFKLESSAQNVFQATDKLNILTEGPIGAGVDEIAIGVRFIDYG